jgi:hypothetical protein
MAGLAVPRSGGLGVRKAGLETNPKYFNMVYS